MLRSAQVYNGPLVLTDSSATSILKPSKQLLAFWHSGFPAIPPIPTLLPLLPVYLIAIEIASTSPQSLVTPIMAARLRNEPRETKTHDCEVPDMWQRSTPK